MTYEPHRLVGNESLFGAECDLQDAAVLDFWQWAFSNLCANNVRGMFAEWMVAKLLDIPQPLRDSWGEWDLTTREGVKIEVKTSAYVQAWPQKAPSKIQFSRLRSRRLDSSTNVYHEESSFNADIYVFCVQIEKRASQWNALNLHQWRFYALMQQDMHAMGSRSLPLAAVERHCAPLTAAEFSAKVKGMIQEMGNASTSPL